MFQHIFGVIDLRPGEPDTVLEIEPGFEGTVNGFLPDDPEIIPYVIPEKKRFRDGPGMKLVIAADRLAFPRVDIVDEFAHDGTAFLTF